MVYTLSRGPGEVEELYISSECKPYVRLLLDDKTIVEGYFDKLMEDAITLDYLDVVVNNGRYIVKLSRLPYTREARLQLATDPECKASIFHRYRVIKLVEMGVDNDVK
jgi:hypothetical protein